VRCNIGGRPGGADAASGFLVGPSPTAVSADGDLARGVVDDDDVEALGVEIEDGGGSANLGFVDAESLLGDGAIGVDVKRISDCVRSVTDQI